MMVDQLSLQNLDLLSILGNEYNPCTSNQPLTTYIHQESNGPFLRPLCLIWRQIGSPNLKSFAQFTSIYNDQEQDQVNLATLSLQQEFTIASFIRHSIITQDSFITLQPFSMFASQLDLFCKIKTELIGLKNDIPDSQLDALYDEIWQTVIQEFVQQKENGCCNANNQHQNCLGRLIWGEAFDWSSTALYFSFIGYLEQNKLALKHKQSNENMFPVAPSSSSSRGIPSIANSVTPATSLADSQGFPSPPNIDSTMQITPIEPSSLPITSTIDQLFIDHSSSSFIQSRRPTWTDFWDTNMISHFLNSNIEQQQSSPQSGFSENIFEIQMPIAESSISPSTSAPTLSELATTSSPIRPKFNRSRSNNSSIAKKQSTSERSKRHYIKAKAERNVLRNICGRLNDLTYELQTSKQLRKTSITESMVNARSRSSSTESISILPMRNDVTENDSNRRKRESKLRKRNEDLQNAERLIGYAKMIVNIPFSHLLNRIAYIKSGFDTSYNVSTTTTTTTTNSSEDQALDKVLQIWLEYEYNWKEILEGVQRLKKSNASTLDHPVDMAIRLLRAGSTL